MSISKVTAGLLGALVVAGFVSNVETAVGHPFEPDLAKVADARWQVELARSRTR